jgi:hypothetical protein
VRLQVSGRVESRGSAEYIATYSTCVSGDYSLSVLLHGAHIAASPYRLHVAAASVRGKCCHLKGGVFHATIVAGEHATFQIHTADAFGNLLAHGGKSISVVPRLRADGAKVLPPLEGSPALNTALHTVVNDNQNGTYEVALQGKVCGRYDVEVLVDDEGIMGSPFSLAISPAPTDAAHCKIAVHWDGDAIAAGVASELAIEVFDMYANRRRCGGDVVRLSLVEASASAHAAIQPVSAVCFDQLDGTYVCEFSCNHAGEYLLRADVNGSTVPFARSLRVLPGVVTLSQCRLVGLPPAAVAGQPVRCIVESFDSYGNRVCVGGMQLESLLSGPASVRVPLRDNHDGTYALETTASASGEYRLYISSAAAYLAGSPFALSVASSVATAAHCSAHGKGLRVASVEQPAEFIVHVRDWCGYSLRCRTCDTRGACVFAVLEYSLPRMDHICGTALGVAGCLDRVTRQRIKTLTPRTCICVL